LIKLEIRVEPSLAPPAKLWRTVSFTAAFARICDGVVLEGEKLEEAPPEQPVKTAKDATKKMVALADIQISSPKSVPRP
jgi:hypothetical protein